MDKLSRREVLRLGGITLLGVVVPDPLLRLLGAAPPPWDVLPGVAPSATDRFKVESPIILGTGKRNEYPAIAAGEGRVWAAWVTAEDGKESLIVRPLTQGDSREDLDQRFSAARCHRPSIALAGDEVWVAWAGSPSEVDSASHGSGHAAIVLARVQSGGSLQIVARIPAAGWAGGTALLLNRAKEGFLAWEERSNEGFLRIRAVALRGGEMRGSPVVIAGERGHDTRRPALAWRDEQTAWLVWDQVESEGTMAIVATTLGPDGKRGRTQKVSVGGGLHLAPAAASDSAGRTWVAWTTNCWPDGTADVVRRVAVAALDAKGKVSWPPQPEGMARETMSTVQGLEFPQLACTADGRVWLTARASQNFFVSVFDGRTWSPLLRLERDGWGGRGARVSIAALGPGAVITARRDLDDAVAQKISVPSAAPVKMERWIRTPVPAQVARVRERIDFDPWGKWNFYFGDLHGHTAYSDGMGEIDEYYRVRRDLYALDFAALTDHDSFVGNTISPSEWEEMKALTDHFNEPRRFVTLFGQEWTSLRVPRGGGHWNVYAINREVPLFDHTQVEYESAQKLVAAARKFGAIVVPHHIGWTGTVWEAFAPDVTPLVEIVSVHGAHEFLGNRPLAHRGGMRGYFVQDGLARGLRFGLIGGTDCHGLLWQHGECWKRDPYQGGLACVLAEELTREAIFDALRQRRCYATSGIRMRMVFEVNGAPMGSEISATDKVQIKVDVASESRLLWIEIVRDNATVHSFGGEGHRSTFTWEDPDWAGRQAGETSYYYLRVTCRDDNMGWSSPIWVTRAAS